MEREASVHSSGGIPPRNPYMLIGLLDALD